MNGNLLVFDDSGSSGLVAKVYEWVSCGEFYNRVYIQNIGINCDWFEYTRSEGTWHMTGRCSGY